MKGFHTVRQEQDSWWWPRVVGVLLYGLLAGYLFVQGTNALPDPNDSKDITCDGKVMGPGDRCLAFSSSGSGERTYEEMRDSERQGTPALAYILFGLGALALAGMGWRARKMWHARPDQTMPGIRQQQSSNLAGPGQQRTAESHLGELKELRQWKLRDSEAHRQKWLRNTTAIVGGVNPSLEFPTELVLGRYSLRDGTLGVVGVVQAVENDDFEEIAELLSAAGAEHPWKPTMPDGGTDRRVRVDCTTVAPEIVVEIRVDPDAVCERGRWQQVEFVSLRYDLTPGQVPAGHKLATTDQPSP
ncbi:hypothetical protein ACFU99_04710 [Streptomyces sp. NPDC057654]|uniref:hypothetical protein n=1 Tax=Streptomyces sp. NPDC057654 TaxID=3346196 RepID=UPI0036D164B6